VAALKRLTERGGELTARGHMAACGHNGDDSQRLIRIGKTFGTERAPRNLEMEPNREK
jgi:hypothetical protein